MMWRAVERAPLPGHQKGWYVADRDHNMVYCGIGEEGLLLAQRVERGLNLVPITVAVDQKYSAELQKMLRAFCGEVIAFRPFSLGDKLPNDHELHPVIVAIRELYMKAAALQKFLAFGPDIAALNGPRVPMREQSCATVLPALTKLQVVDQPVGQPPTVPAVPVARTPLGDRSHDPDLAHQTLVETPA
jgi:hypothetical protein